MAGTPAPTNQTTVTVLSTRLLAAAALQIPLDLAELGAAGAGQDGGAGPALLALQQLQLGPQRVGLVQVVGLQPGQPGRLVAPQPLQLGPVLGQVRSKQHRTLRYLGVQTRQLQRGGRPGLLQLLRPPPQVLPHLHHSGLQCPALRRDCLPGAAQL